MNKHPAVKVLFIKEHNIEELEGEILFNRKRKNHE